MSECDRFHNAIRILYSIDKDELERALGRPLTVVQWKQFSDDPPRFFIRADDETVAAIWTVVERRQPKRSAPGFYEAPDEPWVKTIKMSLPNDCFRFSIDVTEGAAPGSGVCTFITDRLLNRGEKTKVAAAIGSVRPGAVTMFPPDKQPYGANGESL
jgi:hypothetical protein